jgi:spermidine synthase
MATKKLQRFFDLSTLAPAADAPQPYVIEDAEIKALHFDGRSVQSRMRKDAPHELQFGYTRAMMGFLLFQPAPRDILIVGLGGGSLSKYCHYHLPQTTITTVEINPAVIALREEFAIPADSENFRVIHADAADYLADKTAIADIILLDGFEDYGLPPALSSPRFYSDCRRALREGGILVANLWGSPSVLQRCYRRLRAGFEQKMLTVPSPTSDNVVAFAFRRPSPPPWTTLQARALKLQRDTALDFPYVLDEMRSSANAAIDASQWLPGLFKRSPTDHG